MEKSNNSRIRKLCEEIFPDVKEPIRIINKEGGLTNHNYQVVVDKTPYIFRLAGPGTNELINRSEEKICTEAASALEIDAPLIYFDADTGEKVSRYIEGSITMSPELLNESKNMEAVANLIRKLHSFKVQVPVKFDVFEKIKHYESLIKKTMPDCFWDDYESIKTIVNALQEEVESLNIETFLCHNDPLCENFITTEQRMYLVDWEYAGTNDPLWDVADVIIEANYTKEKEEEFINYYFRREATPSELRRILINKVFLDFLWSLWGLQRYSSGVDLYDYATERYLRAKENIKYL